jgi:AcrR family transcriptional regulator
MAARRPLPTPDRAARRRALAAATVPRFVHEGYGDASLDLLAADAGLRRTALLFWFSGKAELYAEAAVGAAAELYGTLARLVSGERGPAAIRALRRGLDELSRIRPDVFALHLDASGAPLRMEPAQRDRLRAAEGALQEGLARALDPSPAEEARRLAQLAVVAFFGLHREARARGRPDPGEAGAMGAALDFAEGHFAQLARSLR